MFQDLRTILDRESICSDGSFTLITEMDLIDSTFLVSPLLAKHVSSGKAICLLTTTRSFHHYQQVGNKLGVNLRNYNENGQIYVIESLKRQWDQFKNQAKTLDNDEDESPGMNLDLQPLFMELKTAVDKFIAENRRFLIIIDDLSVWIDIGIALKEIVTFIQYCRKITQNGTQGALVAVTSLDKSEQDGAHHRLSRHLTHFSDLKIDICELATGYSKEIHGELILTWYNRKLESPNLAERTNQKLQFKIEDKRVLTFPIGTSSAVL